MKKILWAVVCCEGCSRHFAIVGEPEFPICPYCGSEETVGTGEYLSNSLYTEEGKEI